MQDNPPPTTRPRLLIEEWLPAPALGVECMRERSTGQQPPDKRLHVWWARRPLVVSRAAVLASLLPADFDRACFERLLGFGIPGSELVRIRARMDTGVRVEGGFGGGRAFSNVLDKEDLRDAHAAVCALWGNTVTVIDPMAGGGSIPLEAARLGLHVLANELNPVACSVLEATVDYPFRFAPELAGKARRYGTRWQERAAARLAAAYPREPAGAVHAYIFARTVPCPDTGHPTPLVPDWHLLKPAGQTALVAMPVVLDKDSGAWTIEVKEIGTGAGQLRHPPQPTYKGGRGISLFTGGPIPSDYIKAMAQQGKMGSVLYAVVLKTGTRRQFRPAERRDREALAAAEAELARLRPEWERNNIIPTERVPPGDKTKEPLNVGITAWADMFSPRQLLAMGVLVEELRRLRPEIIAKEGEEAGEAIVHLLAFALDKFANYSNMLASWNAPRQVVRSLFDRHDFSFKATFAEMAACVAGSGLAWAIENVAEAWQKLAKLPRANGARPVCITHGDAANLLHLDDGSVTAVVVDPPYADNVQYGELADFFYVWLKRTQGHRRPEWFSTYLCNREEEEAVVNLARHRENGALSAAEARERAHAFYERRMAEIFREAHRVLREDGVLTVMFTHKQQSAWEALFRSLIGSGFTVTATWPVRTESPHSLHQARKNAAQSTVILAARKRLPGAGVGYFNAQMTDEIRQVARATAARLQGEGLNPVDQLVGTFGPAMEVFSRYDEVRTDTGEPVCVAEAIQVAADAVAEWRVERLASRGVKGVDPESRFTLLCWDVLGAAEFRFNEAMLLGRAVGMDVASLVEAGLLARTGDKVRLLSARERRRDEPIRLAPGQLVPDGAGETRRRRGARRRVHPHDAVFHSAIDECHALALRHAEAGGGDAGIGAAASMARQRGWTAESRCARLMAALVNAAPEAVRFSGNGRQKTAADDFPEFRAWHALLKPLFGIEPPEWKRRLPDQLAMRDVNGTWYAGLDEEPEEDKEEGEDA